MPQHYGNGAKGAPKKDMDRATHGSQHGEKVEPVEKDVPVNEPQNGLGQEPAYSGGEKGVPEPETLADGRKVHNEPATYGSEAKRVAAENGPLVPSQVDPTPPRDPNDPAKAGDLDRVHSVVEYLVSVAYRNGDINREEYDMLNGILKTGDEFGVDKFR